MYPIYRADYCLALFIYIVMAYQLHKFIHVYSPSKPAVAFTEISDFAGTDVCVWRVDWKNRITFINEAWMDFAIKNGAPEKPARIIDTDLMDHIAIDEVRRLTSMLLERVRSTPAAVVLPFRCDSLKARRLMEMAIRPLNNNGLEFRETTLRVYDRDLDTHMEHRYANRDEIPISCSWCNRVQSGEKWVEIEVAIWEQELFELDRVPPLSYSLCDECREIRFRSSNGH